MRFAISLLFCLAFCTATHISAEVSFMGRQLPQSRNAMSLHKFTPFMPYDKFMVIQELKSDSAGNVVDSVMVVTEEPAPTPEWTDIDLLVTPEEAAAEAQESAYFIPRLYRQLPTGMYGTVVFDTYHYLDSLPLVPATHPSWAGDAFNWLDDVEFGTHLLNRTRQAYMTEHPLDVKYNVQWLPEPPKHYQALVDATTTKIVLKEIPLNNVAGNGPELDIEHRHWLRTFNGNLQFSQAYVSPNWYQGGNNNLNALLNVVYNVKLNEKLHPNLLFETNISYKLGLNNAPNDTLHSYNISEDLFQITSKFGIKAVKNWYYSINGSFKTQLLNNYPTNSSTLTASFLSPGELNLGVGMSYSYTSPKKSITFGASLSPISYNLKTCTNSRIDETIYGIKSGRHTTSEYGSSAECNFRWKIAYNINYTSRLFVFTDYDYIYSDWEHTISFDINRFLSTQIYAHMRYDSSTPRLADSTWHKFQLKEILSFGFNYKFSTI